jgi:hypothetical protein
MLKSGKTKLAPPPPTANLTFMEVVAYVVSCLAILWSFGGGHLPEVFWSRVFIAGPLCLVTALVLLKTRKELKILKPHSGSWMMGIGIGLVMFLVGILLAWFNKEKTAQLSDLSHYKIAGLLAWAFILSPACEIIYRHVLAPSWGIKSSAFIEALSFGVGAVNFYLFLIVFVWGYIGSRLSMRFGIVASMVARGLATLLLIISLQAVL